MGDLGNTIVNKNVGVPGNLGNTVVCRKFPPPDASKQFCVLSRGLSKTGPPFTITIIPIPVPFYPSSLGTPLVFYDNFGTGENANPIVIPVEGIYELSVTVLFAADVPPSVTVGLAAIKDATVIASDIVGVGASKVSIDTISNFSPGSILFTINLVSVDPLAVVPAAGTLISCHLLAPPVGTTVCFTNIG